jgi:hypothetical protein
VEIVCAYVSDIKQRLIMRSLPLIIALIFISFIAITSCVHSSGKKDHLKNNAPTLSNNGPIENYVINRLQYRSKLLKDYAIKNGYNSTICFIADMRLYSGRNRFFAYQMDKDSIILQGLVAHGRCNERWLEGRKYGNNIGCGCSALGKYKIGKSYNGRFGLAYKLYGLDSSNNNAFKRAIVLHAHECVPYREVYPDAICQSDGCPTVAPQFLQKLSKIIDVSEKPILLLLFDE